MIKTADQVGQIIKDLRTKNDMTQEQLASKLQITYQAVSKWEKGESYPDIQQIGSLCDLFNITMDDLLNETPKKTIKKNKYRVYEKIENEKGIVEIIDVDSTSRYDVVLLLHNKSDLEIPLKNTYFLLLDVEGNSIDPQKLNIVNYDNDLLGLSLLHKIPDFIPPMTKVHVTLKFSKKIDIASLWINIPNFISGVHFEINAKLHNRDYHRVNMKSFTREEKIDYYNFNFKKGEEFKNNLDYPKITSDFIDDLMFPKTMDFFKDYRQLFDETILNSVATGEEYSGWSFIINQIKDPSKIREIVKKNYKNIEKEIESGHGGIIKYSSIEEFMDQEIIEFIIKMRARYVKDYREWTLEYISNDNVEGIKSELIKLKYITNAQLFKSKLSTDIVNDIIRKSDVSEINEQHVLQIKRYYKDSVEIETMDYLLSLLPIENIETLTRYKPLMSIEAWSKKKDEFFEQEQEQEKLNKLKNQL